MKSPSHSAIVAFMSTALDIFDMVGVQVQEGEGYPITIRNKSHTYPRYDFSFVSERYGKVSGTIYYDFTHFRIEKSQLLKDEHPSADIAIISGKWNIHCSTDGKNFLYYANEILNHFEVLLGKDFVKYRKNVSLSNKDYNKRCRERSKFLNSL